MYWANRAVAGISGANDDCRWKLRIPSLAKKPLEGCENDLSDQHSGRVSLYGQVTVGDAVGLRVGGTRRGGLFIQIAQAARIVNSGGVVSILTEPPADDQDNPISQQEPRT